jgi:hypothetical protein
MATNPLPLILLAGGAALLLGSKKKSGSSGGGSANGPKSPSGGNGKPLSEVFGDIKWNKIRLDKSSAGMDKPPGLPIPEGAPLSIVSLGYRDELEIVYTGGDPDVYVTSLRNENLMIEDRRIPPSPIPEGAKIVSEISKEVIEKPFRDPAGNHTGATISAIFRPGKFQGEALLSVREEPIIKGPQTIDSRTWTTWAILVRKEV